MCENFRRDDKCVQTSVWKPEAKSPLGRYKGMWEDNIKMVHKCCVRVSTCFFCLRIRCDDRLVDTSVELRIPLKV
jgi:hypothetical protein